MADIAVPGDPEAAADAAASGVAGSADAHQHDLVMPGFRFHPTEEEIIEFYLRRKVEGRRFNVDLIVSVDLYRYDPWDLPALAVIGDKEWFFYVARDRKYRNGDRPNRVTPSGYWKATGADRAVRVEKNRAIGLKKTLVFYAGKAPKGIRSSWIMNEYRLPHGDAAYHRQHKQAETSLCRVYKRPGIDDHMHVARLAMPAKLVSSAASSAPKKQTSTQNWVSPPPPLPSYQSIQGGLPHPLRTEKPKKIHSHDGGADKPMLITGPPPSPLMFPSPVLATSVDSDGGILPPVDPQEVIGEFSTVAVVSPDNLTASVLPPMIYDHQLLLPPPYVDKLWQWNPFADAQKNFAGFK